LAFTGNRLATNTATMPMRCHLSPARGRILFASEKQKFHLRHRLGQLENLRLGQKMFFIRFVCRYAVGVKAGFATRTDSNASVAPMSLLRSLGIAFDHDANQRRYVYLRWIQIVQTIFHAAAPLAA
jgi:hypothetical protein